MPGTRRRLTKEPARHGNRPEPRFQPRSVGPLQNQLGRLANPGDPPPSITMVARFLNARHGGDTGQGHTAFE